MKNSKNIVVVGLGYVGLPLALAFADEFTTVGFDTDQSRIDQLVDGSDRNLEVSSEAITSSSLHFTSDEMELDRAEVIVVTVPTPVTDDQKPDLSLLESASLTVGKSLKRRSDLNGPPVVVFESTTYPGCTEDFCGAIIARESGLVSGKDFFLGYSPERTNFGDQDHTLQTVVKVVSGQTVEALEAVAEVYGRIASAGVHRAPDIKTAEASKVIENVQRDLNIALFNESAMIFDRMGIDSASVFEAAGTKWNFHKYQPGLVGGHCIPVDPYYLMYAAQQVDYAANVILAGRQVNERMTHDVAEKVHSLVLGTGRTASDSDVLVLGQTFKSDVADFRNSKARTLSKIFADSYKQVESFDPFEELSPSKANPFDSNRRYDVVVLAVGHSEFTDSPEKIPGLVQENGVLVDLTGSLKFEDARISDITFWKL